MGIFRYHSENVREYPETAERRDDEDLMDVLKDYEVGGRRRGYLTGGDGEDHRAWRRAVLREALRRGLIDEDPKNAP